MIAVESTPCPKVVAVGNNNLSTNDAVRQKQLSIIDCAEHKGAKKDELESVVEKLACAEKTDFEDCLSEDEGECVSLRTNIELISFTEHKINSLPEGVRNIDEHDEDDAQCCVEYVNDMFNYLFERQVAFHKLLETCPASTDWMPKKREILIDWVIDVCVKFKLLSETFFTFVHLMDTAIRHESMRNIDNSKIQLFGCTCLWIAAKVEQRYSPECRDFVYISDRGFTKEKMIAMEIRVLNATLFNLNFPTSLTFLRRFSKAAQSDATIHTLSKYICECSCQSASITTQFLPSEIAAGAVYLARVTHQKEWDETLTYYTRCLAEKACVVAQHLYDHITSESNYKACKRKYGCAKLLNVSKITLIRP